MKGEHVGGQDLGGIWHEKAETWIRVAYYFRLLQGKCVIFCYAFLFISFMVGLFSYHINVQNGHALVCFFVNKLNLILFFFP